MKQGEGNRKSGTWEIEAGNPETRSRNREIRKRLIRVGERKPGRMEREIKENGSGKGKEVFRIKPGSEYGIANRIE